MAQITDLTFEQVNDAAIADPKIGQAIFSINSDAISLNVKALTGDSFTALTNDGFVELMYKLNRIASQAQSTVNEDVTLPQEQLNSFPPITFGLPDLNGNIQVSCLSRYSIPIDVDNAIGTN